MSEVATRLALTMVEFIQANPPLSSPVWWWIVPHMKRLRRNEVLEALEALPKPIVLAPMVEQGMIGVWPFETSNARGRDQLEHDLLNQQAALQRMLARIVPGAGTVDVLLELEADELIFPSTELQTWAREYLVMTSGWCLAGSGGDPRAAVRLLLRRANGAWSPGGTCSRDSEQA